MSSSAKSPKRLLSTSTRFSHAFRWWAQLVTRHRLLIIMLDICLTVAFVVAAHDLKFDSSFKSLMVAEPEAARVLRSVQENFGREDLFVMVAEGDVFTDEYLHRLRDLHRDIFTIRPVLSSIGRPDRAATAENPEGSEADPSSRGDANGSNLRRAQHRPAGAGQPDVVEQVTSLVNVVVARPQQDELWVGGLLDGWPEERSTAEVRDIALTRRSILGNFVGAAGQHSAITVKTVFADQDDTVRVYEALQAVIARHQADGFQIALSGAPGLGAEVYQLTVRDGIVVSSLSLLLMGALLLAMFRSPFSTIAPLLVVAQTVLWTVGAMTLAGVPLTLLSAVTPTFIFCVGLGDSIHLQSVTQQKAAQGLSPSSACIEAVTQVSLPVIFTSLTTAIGLASFQTSSLQAIRHFGLFSALGVMVALLLSLTFLPAVLSFGTPRSERPDTDNWVVRTWVLPTLSFCNRVSRRDPVTGQNGGAQRVLWIAAFASLLCAFGISRLEMVHYPLTWLPSDSPARTAVEAMDAHLGGAADFTLLVERTDGGDVRELALLRELEGLEHDMLSYRDSQGEGQLVKGTVGVLDLARETWTALAGGDMGNPALPPNQRCLYDTFTVLESGAADFLQRFVTTDNSAAVMYARTKWMDDGAFQTLIQFIEGRIAARFGDGAVRVGLAGAVYDAAASGMVVLPDLMSSFGTAFLVITVLMVLALQDVKLGMVAMVPNLLPILAVVAFMGFTDIALDLSTLVVASVGIGIVVDDTIHFLHHFSAHYRRYQVVDDAIDEAFRCAGPAMIQTSLVLMAGFLVCLVAELNNIRMFGLLVAVTVWVALVVDLIFVPALLRITYGGRQPSAEPMPLTLNEGISRD